MERIESIDDERVAAYRNLPERTRRGEEAFIAEGRTVAARMIESGWPVESVFAAEGFAEEFDRLLAGRAPLYVASRKLLAEVAGFNFHRGVLAHGRRRPALSLDDLMARLGPAGPVTLVFCPEIRDRENLGLLLRTAAAFGIDGVVLGPGCCDPYSRRCLRLSMGGVFRVPLAASAEPAGDLAALERRWSVEPVATVCDPAAEDLRSFRRPRRLALLFGNEWAGLAEPLLALCRRRVTIPIRPDADSLNLAVAAGIFLHAVTRPGPAGS